VCFGDDRMEGKLGLGHWSGRKMSTRVCGRRAIRDAAYAGAKDRQVSSSLMKQASGWKRTNQAEPAPELELEPKPEPEPEPELERGGSCHIPPEEGAAGF